MKQFISYSSFFYILFVSWPSAQTHFPADPYYLLMMEKNQFEGNLPLSSNLFRPVFFNTDSLSFSFTLRSEGYYNDNAPNQENMDVRYFSKGVANFNSMQIAMNSPYLLFLAEPYIMSKSSHKVSGINRSGAFSVLNDRPLQNTQIPGMGFRNLLAFIHYKGFGFGWHAGNRWWGPGLHTNLQMTNNTKPFAANIVGTLKEIRLGAFGMYAVHTLSKLNDLSADEAIYFTSLKAQLTWYGPAILSLGFSRNYLTGGIKSSGYKWTIKDARKIVFEDIFISNLVNNEYTVGGSDPWDQTLSGYLSITLPDAKIKIYSEIGWNDNRMYFADFLSQPDHSMATVIGLRDYGVGSNKNFVWGFEWTNLMISYTSRHRGIGGSGPWYDRELYDYSTYQGRRWAAHSGSDSDDWYVYGGFLSDKLMIVPALNYERHGIVSHRPAEVKLEFRLDSRYKYKDIWFGIFMKSNLELF